ncbi:hypothetical protein L9F63_008405, partial [Diploptera punctata]
MDTKKQNKREIAKISTPTSPEASPLFVSLPAASPPNNGGETEDSESRDQRSCTQHKERPHKLRTKQLLYQGFGGFLGAKKLETNHKLTKQVNPLDKSMVLWRLGTVGFESDFNIEYVGSPFSVIFWVICDLRFVDLQLVFGMLYSDALMSLASTTIGGGVLSGRLESGMICAVE